MTTLTELRNRAAALGYTVLTNVVDDMGRRWKYRTAPGADGGPWGQFKSMAELEEYILQVERIQRMKDSSAVDACHQ